MKIGIGTTSIEPGICHGKIDGMGVYTNNLIQYFHKNHYSVVRVAYTPLKKIFYKNLCSPEVNLFPPYIIAMASQFVQLGSYLNRKIENKIDIFHSPDYCIPQFKKIPVVATLHDAIMFKHPEWCNQRLRTLKNFILKKSIKHADHFIAISNIMVADLIEYWGIEESKISVVHNGITHEWFKQLQNSEKEPVLNKFNLKEKKFLLSVGTLQPRKNIVRLLKAYEALPKDIKDEYPLILIGKNGWQTEEIIQEINRLRKESAIQWLQYIDDKDLKVLYQSAKLFLFPSLSEGFGAPILEAFASKTPVLTSNVTSLPEVAGEAAYYVDPYSIESITQGLSTLLTSDSLCNELVDRGEKRVTEFSWEKCSEKTLAIYKKLL